ncbi:hypothetical protein TEA_023268 [Camellia sinensis var. sinensis]|uniref:Uncharacterized protein n=1 Tax=Camellia sinensis var. sinensis TaxID=542762 RepID=A0A4S4DJT2_CAMSN|nr:hypothetical protein TEA_023268 [Camellia sinensis var. sinensis]
MLVPSATCKEKFHPTVVYGFYLFSKHTHSMIGLLLAIEVLAIVFGGWSGLEGDGDWGKVPATVHMIIFSLVYHDLAPIVCAYLRGDLQRIKASVVLGSVVSLSALLVWDAVALGLSAHADQVSDLVKLLLSVYVVLLVRRMRVEIGEARYVRFSSWPFGEGILWLYVE